MHFSSLLNMSISTTSQNLMFTAVPGQIDCFLLRSYYQKKLVDSLKCYLTALSKSITIDLSWQISEIEKLDFQRRFSPILYAVYIQLREAYERKNLEEILDCLQLVNNQLLEDVYADCIKYGTILSENWEKPFLQEMRESVPSDKSIHPVTLKKLKIFPLVNWTQHDFPPPSFSRSLDLLKDFDHLLFLEVQAYVSRIKFCSSHDLHSVTSPRYFGAVYMRLPLPEEDEEVFFLETVVHETSHLHLFVIMAYNILVLNDEGDLYASPLRADKRPMLGVFHSVFVLARMVRILRKYCDAFPENLKAKNSLKAKEIGLQEGMTTVSTQAQLSEEGKILFNTLMACAYE